MRIRPSGPLSAAMIAARALTGFSIDAAVRRPSGGPGTAPGRRSGRTQIPRRPTVIAGRLPSKNPLSLISADVGREALAVRLQPGVEVDRARLLLALEDELEVDRQAAASSPAPPRPPETAIVHVRPLSSAAPRARIRPSRTIGSNGGRLPHVERVDRLDVVVAVDEHGRGAGGVEPVGVDDRVAAGLGDLHVLEADRAISSPASHSAARRQSGACSGSAEMLGMRRKSA